MNRLNEAVNLCICKMKASSDFSDCETIAAIKNLLSVIISNPVQLINCTCEEKLSLALSSVMTSQFPEDYPVYEGMNVRNVVFVCAYYLHMHQLEEGTFYDRNWPAFILLFHLCRQEFVKFSLDMNPFAPERVQQILGRTIDYTRLNNIAKGVELNLMLTAKSTGYLIEDFRSWYDELYADRENLLINKDPFTDAAIPLYTCIGNYLKENDLTFIEGVN